MADDKRIVHPEDIIAPVAIIKAALGKPVHPEDGLAPVAIAKLVAHEIQVHHNVSGGQHVTEHSGSTQTPAHSGAPQGKSK